MTYSRRTFFISTLCVLVMGFGLGLVIDARYRPNRIRFQIEKSMKVYLSPQQGDIVEWTAEGPMPKQLNIGFLGDTPCEQPPDAASGSSIRNCTVKPALNGVSYDAKTYVYYCPDGKNNSLCIDPGWGPVSGTGGRGGLVHLLGRLGDLVALHEPSIGGTVGVFVRPTGKPGEGGQIALPPPYTPNPYVTCNSSQDAVMYPDPSSGISGNIVVASRGKPIEWGAGIDFDFTLAAGTCAESASTDPTRISSTGQLTCTVLSSANTQNAVTIQTKCPGLKSKTMDLEIP